MSTGVFVTDVSNIGGNVDMYAGTWSVYNTGWQSFTTQSNQPLAKFELKGVSTYKNSATNYAAGTFKMTLFGPSTLGPAPYNLMYVGGPQNPSAGYRPHLLEETFTTPSGSDKADYVWDIQAAAAQAAASGDTTAQTALNSAGAGSVFTVEFVPTDSAYYAEYNQTGSSPFLQTISATDGGNASTMISNLTSSSGTQNPENSYVFQTYYELPASQLQTIAATATNFTQTEWVNAGSPAYFNLASGWTSIASAGQSSGQTFTNADNIGYIGIPTSVTTIGTFAFAGVTALQTISFDGDIGLTNIPDSMCRGCSNLAAINFGTANTTLKNIKTEAFNGCINLNNVVIPASVQAIYLSAFLDCANLRSLTIAAGSDLRTIGESAFKASGITSFTVPGKVTAIAERAFRDCWSLSTITIEQSENWAYGLRFASIITTFDPTNAVTFFPDYSGALSHDIFSRVVDNGNGPSVIRGPDINFTMTKGQRINGDAYFSTTGFMNGGNNDFYNSGHNSTLTLSAMVNHVVIRNPSYSGTIVVGSEFTIRDWETAGSPMKFKIEGYETITNDQNEYDPTNGIFNGTNSATVDSITSIIIGDGVSEVRGPDLFLDISNLTSFVIGKDVTTIPYGLTKMTPNLTNITVDGANPNFYVEGNILYKVSGVNNTATTHNVSVGAVSGTNRYLIDSQSYPALTFTRGSTYTLNINTTGHPFWIQTTDNWGSYDSSNTYNNGVTNNGATSGTITFVVPYDAPNTLYYRCQHHTGMGNTINIVSDSGVNTKHTLIQYNPASTASSNHDIDTGVEVIGHSSFGRISTLITVTIPTSVTHIKNDAFAQCFAITSVNFTPGSQLAQIGSNAFAACPSLTSFTIPNKVTDVYIGAFDQCQSLTTFNIDGSEDWTTGINFFHSSLYPIFRNNNALTNVNMIFGQKINIITDFYEVSPTITPVTYLTNGATGVFFGSPSSTVINLTQRTGLITITNPNYTGSVDTGSKFTIDDWMAAGYPASFKVVGYETIGQSTQPPYFFEARFDGSDSTALQTLKGYMGTITHVEIGDGVTTIDGLLFDSMMNLTSITIGRDVASIPEGFVYTMPSVSSVFNTIALDNNNTNFTVASNVLYKVNGANTKHTLVQYPLGSSVTNFSIPSGVVVLRDGAMASYNGMSVTIPTSLTTIKAYALYGCSNLSTITFATGTSSLETIGDYAFGFNTSLSSISLPVSVASIGAGAFSNSSNLANVTFKGVSGSGNITIGSGAFANASSSLQVTLYNRVSIDGELQSSIGTSTGSFFGSPVSTTINIIKAPDGFKPADRAALDAAITDWITAVDSGITSNITTVTSSYGDINTWDVSLVTNMSALFANKNTFNSNIGDWNTTSVTDMSTMFHGATTFNHDISGWTTTNVENMTDMFVDADAFNQDLSGWDVSGITGNRFMTYVYTPLNVIPAPICFPAGTPVLTDQGEVDIDKIDPKKHTIRGKKIEGITETVAIEDYVVMIHKNTFFKNVPIRDTIISANHKIMFNNQMIQAREFVDKNMYPRDIYKIPYTGYTLYNVLLEDYNGLMMVNNLIAETLSPTSVNAWLFRKLKSDISNSERKEVMDTYMQRLFPAPEITSFVIGCK